MVNIKLSAIIICEQNNKYILSKQLEVLEKDCAIKEIIIVNNSFKSLDFNSPKLKILPTNKKLYKNQCWNFAIKNIESEGFVFIDESTLIPYNFCSNAALYINPEKGVFGINSRMIKYSEDILEFQNIPNANCIILEEENSCTKGFNLLVFGHKNSFYRIPNKLKILCGVNYLAYMNKRNGKINYSISGTQIKCNQFLLPGFYENKNIKKSDVYYFSKYDPVFKKHKLYHNLGLRHRIFSVQNTFNRTVVNIFGIKLNLCIDKYAKEEFLNFYKENSDKSRKNILIIDSRVPRFDQNAGEKSTYYLIKMYQKLGLNVWFLPADFVAQDIYSQILRNRGVKILTDYKISRKRYFFEWLKINHSLLDIVLISRPECANKFLYNIKQYNIKTIYYGQDLHYLRKFREYQIVKNPAILKEAEKFKIMEYKIFRNADVSLFPSRAEQAEIHRNFPEANINIIPVYAFDATKLPDVAASETRKNLTFVGNFYHTPNFNGIKWFVKEIFPLILKEIPDIKLQIAGLCPYEEILSLKNDHIEVLGFISDANLKALYRNTKIVVAPLLFGAGVKGKIVEALFHGTPVVTTGIGAEGINNNGAISVADKEHDFAKLVVELYNNESKYNFAASKCLDIVKKQFTENLALQILEKEIETSDSLKKKSTNVVNNYSHYSKRY